MDSKGIAGDLGMMKITLKPDTKLVKDCMAIMATNFLFENVLTQFGCSKILMSDHGTHFLNETISTLTEEFQVYH